MTQFRCSNCHKRPIFRNGLCRRCNTVLSSVEPKADNLSDTHEIWEEESTYIKYAKGKEDAAT